MAGAMRITTIVLRNYRQYRNVKILFNCTTGRDLHTIIGMGGAGKTNILNAINWCLYGDEPHLSQDSQQLPRLNLGTIINAESGQRERIRVELWTEANGNTVTFIREENYICYENNQPKLQDTNFEVWVRDTKGNTKMLAGDDTNLFVERFVPKRIREFFFFDVEKLDNYFKGATGQKIMASIFQISQLSLLSRIEKKLQSVLADLSKDAVKQNPNLAKIGGDLEQKKEELEEIYKKKDECIQQIGLAKEKIAEYQDKLKGYPDTAKLQMQIEKLQEHKKHIERILAQKVQEKQDLLFEYGKFMLLFPIIEQSIKIIQDKREKKQIPPLIEPTTLEKIQQDKHCGICGRDFEPNSPEDRHIEKLLEDIRISSDINKEIFKMESPLYTFTDRTKQFKTTMRKITNELNHHENELQKCVQDISEIDSQMASTDVEKIGNWQKERTTWENVNDTNQQRLGMLSDDVEKHRKLIQQLEKEFSQGLQKEEKQQEIKLYIDFSTQALMTIKEASTAVLKYIREQIEHETEQQFFKLIWKKETFKKVSIDESYNLHVLHSQGYECLGTLAASERELLTLSFIFALHKISGFDSPLLVDTPVARVSDKQRENFARVFTEIDPNKQAILLFTPSEYSEEVSRFHDQVTSNKFILKPSSDEKETNLEVL